MEEKHQYIRLIQCIVLLTFSSAGLLAQSSYLSGFIVKNSGDTIIGLIKLGSSRENCQKCIFKSDKETKSKTYLPTDLQSYHFDNILLYISREIRVENEIKKVFLEWAVMGKMNLYLFDDPKRAMRYFVDRCDSGFVELVNTTHQFTDKTGGMFLHENREYAATLAMMLHDYPAIAPEIYKTRLEARDLIRLSSDFHNMVCPDQKCIMYKRPENGTKMSFGPILGIYSSSLHQPAFSDYPPVVQALSKIHFETSVVLEAGLIMEFSNLPFLSPRLAWRSEITFFQTNYAIKLMEPFMPQINSDLEKC